MVPILYGTDSIWKAFFCFYRRFAHVRNTAINSVKHKPMFLFKISAVNANFEDSKTCFTAPKLYFQTLLLQKSSSNSFLNLRIDPTSNSI